MLMLLNNKGIASKMSLGGKRQTHMRLSEYITKHFGGNQRKFAAAQKIAPPQVTQWLNAEFIVVDDILYSKRRVIEREVNKK